MSFYDRPRRSRAIFTAVPRALGPSHTQCTSAVIGLFGVFELTRLTSHGRRGGKGARFLHREALPRAPAGCPRQTTCRRWHKNEVSWICDWRCWLAPLEPSTWLAGHCLWVLVWTGACYWHGVGGFMFYSSSSCDGAATTVVVVRSGLVAKRGP